MVDGGQYICIPRQPGKLFKAFSVDRDSYVVAMDISSASMVTDDIGCQIGHIGKYSSLGGRINCIMAMSHDYHSLYQGVIQEFATGMDRRHNGQIWKRIQQKGQILIGNDVWVGDGVTILGGVRIGDGAVIAADSVVVKDVPPYAVVGGNPARLIKYRFPEEVIRQLKRIAWWNWSSEELSSRKEDMQGEVADFAAKYDAPLSLYPRKSGRFVPRLRADVPLLVYFMDFTDDYPVHTHVISSFIETYHQSEAELLLCYNAEKQKDADAMQGIVEALEKYMQHIPALINVCGISPEDEEKVISEADLYLTNRDLLTLPRVALCDRYHVGVASGVDIPLFPKKDFSEYANEAFFVE
jgi:virginiamycin A acetyltransferase